MTYVSKPSRLAELALKLTPPDKRAEVRAAIKAGETPPPPKFPIGAPPPPTSPDGPFTDASATAVAQFIISANERRLKGCPPVTPTNETAKFIVGTVAKLRARI